ncbi:MAG: sugar nucleotide-binding protein [Candidatus Lokiarchaeota archaeon]|nr:sugar nucleotide-binding protein [Candidatus Lokiarchaeota archaeon]
MINILVLGVSGMLGSMVFNYLSKNSDFNVYGTVRNPKFLLEKLLLFDANELSQLENEKFLQLKLDFIINCIGITKPFCRDEDPKGVERAIKINTEFPWKLSKYSMRNDIKVIQIATDCVYSGKRGNYNEDDIHDPLDVYGKTKSLGEVFDGSILNIRCSIIGPEFKQNKSFLFEWFLNQPYKGTIGGYEHHIWNGVTTLQFAQLCEKIIDINSYDDLLKLSHIHHYKLNNTVNKYQLMQIFNKIFGKELEINRVNIPEETVDRTLTSKYPELDKLSHKSVMKEAIFELKKYIDNCEIYNYKV